MLKMTMPSFCVAEESALLLLAVVFRSIVDRSIARPFQSTACKSLQTCLESP